MQVGCLYDIFNDPSEHRDLADEKPQIAAKLLHRLQQLDATLFEPSREHTTPVPTPVPTLTRALGFARHAYFMAGGAPDHAGACGQVERNKGFWGPWL